MLSTCKSTEIPPNPSKKLQIIIFSEIALKGILAIVATPLVSSTIPAKKPSAKEVGIFKKLSKGWTKNSKKSNTLELLSIEIITLKSITNPPIITTVEIELIILLCKIAPKFPKEGLAFLVPICV